jgi:hypothetical protein
MAKQPLRVLNVDFELQKEWAILWERKQFTDEIVEIGTQAYLRWVRPFFPAREQWRNPIELAFNRTSFPQMTPHVPPNAKAERSLPSDPSQADG